jgi:HEAT repeats
MVRSYWLGPVSALLALAGQAPAQTTPPAQPTAGGAQDQVISVRELDRPIQKCRILTTTRQADGSTSWLVEVLATHENMLIFESTVTGPQGQKTTMTRIVHVAGDKMPPGVAAAGSTPVAPAAPNPAPASRPWLNWHWFSNSSPTTPATTTPTTPKPGPAVWWNLRTPATPVAQADAATNTAAVASEPSPTKDWRESWGYTQGATPVEPTSAPKAHTNTASAPGPLPLAVDHADDDPLAQPKVYSRLQLPGKEDEAPTKQPDPPVVIVGPPAPKPSPAEQVKQAKGTVPVSPAAAASAPAMANPVTILPASPPSSAAPTPPAPPPAGRSLLSYLLPRATPPAPVAPAPVAPAPGPMVPPGMGSVLAVRAPELAQPGPPLFPPPMAPVEMNAYESNAFSEPVQPMDPGPAVAPRQYSAGSVPASVMARLPHGQPPGPPMPPDPTGTAMRTWPAPQSGYPMGTMVQPQMPAENYPSGQMAMMPAGPMPERSLVMQTSAEMPVDASMVQLTTLLREAYYPSQREWAASQLAAMNWRAEPGVVVTLMTAARSDKAPLVRAACVRSLAGMTGSPLPVADTLVALRQDPDAQVRHEAEKALADQGR